MKEKALQFIRNFWHSMQILYLRFTFSIARIFHKKLKVNYTAVVDTVVTSNISTLVWSGKRCYKIELADGIFFSGFTKAIPITIHADTSEISVKFHGVREIVKKTIPINRKKIDINLNKLIATNLPQSVSLNTRLNKIALTKQQLPVIQIPAVVQILTPKISFPNFVNE
jgi:hypothetical protein